MPRLGCPSTGRARTLAAVIVFAAATALSACGSSGGGDASASDGAHGPKPAILADVKALRAAPCPAPYLVVHEKHYPKSQVRQALANRFHIHHHIDTLKPPIDWKQDPYHSKAWSAVFASLKWMDVLIYAYRHGDRQALAEARDLMLDWVEHNPRHHPPTQKSWFNKVIGDRAPFLAYITRAASCEGMLSASQAATLVGSIAEHGRALTSKKVYSPSNHGLFMDYGLASMAREASYMPKAAEWRKLAPRRFEKTLLHRVYPNEGFWLENSSSYHLAARLLTEKFIALLGSGVPPSLDRLANRMNEVAGWLIEPDKRRVLLGDSNLKLTPPDILPVAKRDDGLRWLPRSGLGIVKRPDPDPSFLLFAATFHNGTHNQADALTVDLFANGQRVLTDSGLYDKDPDPWQVFSRSSYSHSVMTIDGKSFPLGSGKAYGSGMRAVGQGNGWYAMEGVNPLASLHDVMHHRLVLYKPGFGLVVTDFAQAKSKHTYRRYFQLGPKITATPDHGALRLSGPHGFAAELSSSGTAPSKLALLKGRRHPIRGFIFPDYRNAVPRTTAEYTARGRNVNQVATFGLDAGEPVRGSLSKGSTPNDAMITLKAPGGGPTVLHVTRSGSKLSVSGG
jgi:heparinase II/III-like protein